MGVCWVRSGRGRMYGGMYGEGGGQVWGERDRRVGTKQVRHLIVCFLIPTDMEGALCTLVGAGSCLSEPSPNNSGPTLYHAREEEPNRTGRIGGNVGI